MLGTCAWPACGKAYKARKGQRYCGRRCSGRANASRPRPGRPVVDTLLRDLALRAMQAGPISAPDLARKLYGSADHWAMQALHALLVRATASHYFERQGYHVKTETVYTLAPGRRLKEVAL